MCGIAGMIDWRAATPADALRTIGEAMIESVRHRGPDAGDVWVEAEGGVALGQRRLAIIDLSPGGAQPMHSADWRYVITFNGEIYNFRDIRRELQAAGRSMRSESDTEVLLEACALWGVEAAIEADMKPGSSWSAARDNPDQYVPLKKISKVRLLQLLPLKPIL